MASEISFRRLKPDDTDLAEVAQQLNTTDSEVSIKNFSAESLADFTSDNDRIYLLAYRNREIAGAIHAYLLLHPAGVKYMYVDEVDTVVQHRRHGVAKAMMEEILRLAHAQGADEVWLGTEHDNEPAKALYNSLNPSEIENGPIFTYKVEK